MNREGAAGLHTGSTAATRELVRLARASGTSKSQIARALNIDRSTLRERFADELGPNGGRSSVNGGTSSVDDPSGGAATGGGALVGLLTSADLAFPGDLDLDTPVGRALANAAVAANLYRFATGTGPD